MKTYVPLLVSTAISWTAATEEAECVNQCHSPN